MEVFVSQLNRRNFLALTAAVLVFRGIKVSAEAPAAGALPMVDPNDMLASQLKYVEDAKKAPLSKGKKKCSGCALYTAGGKNAGKAVGACQLFAGKQVYADAYCNSWQEKKKA